MTLDREVALKVMAPALAADPKLEADAKAASAAITYEASFKANIGKVLGNCKGCHDDYRIKK